MQYNTELWLLQSNFDKEYKHTVDFFNFGSSESVTVKLARQFNTLTGLAGAHLTDYTPVYEKDGAGGIKVDGNKDSFAQYNYVIFKNSTSSFVWYAFIDSLEYIAEQTTYIHYTIDVWQTFHLRARYFDSWIDRAHLALADDVLGENLEPEPFSVRPTDTRELSEISWAEDDWEPMWVLHATSKFNTTTKKYEYTGNGSNNYGEYGYFIYSRSDLEDILKRYGRKSGEEILADIASGYYSGDWKDILFNALGSVAGAVPEALYQLLSTSSVSELEDHRNELIGLYAIPAWATPPGSQSMASNTTINKSKTIQLNNTLACGYTPKNKKMLSSVFKSYILYARNGTMVAYKPEAFKNSSGTLVSSTTVTCSCIPMGTSKYYAFMDNYNERDKQFLPIAYRSERRVGYDANTGLNKILNVLSSSEKVLGSAVSLAGGVVAESPSGIISGATGLIGSGISMIDALDSKGVGFGSNGELIDITGARAKLRWADVSPTYNECVHIDRYLTAYGYAQNTIGNLLSNCYTRSRFNFVKSSDPNLRVNAPENYTEKLKQIFKNGVTIWHDYSYMFDYDTNNT